MGSYRPPRAAQILAPLCARARHGGRGRAAQSPAPLYARARARHASGSVRHKILFADEPDDDDDDCAGSKVETEQQSLVR